MYLYIVVVINFHAIFMTLLSLLTKFVTCLVRPDHLVQCFYHDISNVTNSKR